jgi:hypothetical protein
MDHFLAAHEMTRQREIWEKDIIPYVCFVTWSKVHHNCVADL